MPKLKYSSLFFVSSGKKKHSEYCTLLGLSDLKLAEIKIVESQSMNLHTLVEEKINKIKPQLPGFPFFVEHTGLIIDSWNGLPGGLISVFMDQVGNDGLCKMMKTYKGIERVARARIVIGYSHADGSTHNFVGETIGTISPEPRGENNFGWDAIFIPEGDSRTYAEMTLDEKNQTSMRKKVVDSFAKYLDQHFEL
jgi:non-canonical purine NTP pyrophosphatase (RdgB/HAM1 family)